MNNFKLEPGDILVNVSRVFIGEYSHCFLYVGKWYITPQSPIPLLFESNGRGVCLRSLSERYGEEVVVMRLPPQFRDKIPTILDEVIKLASDLQSFYDYSCIIWHIIPRVIFEKLGLKPPLKYQRDEKQVCSEALAEVHWRAEVPILPKNVVPLPGDFTESDILNKVQQGKLSEEWI